MSGHYDSMCGNVMNSNATRRGERRCLGNRRRDRAGNACHRTASQPRWSSWRSPARNRAALAPRTGRRLRTRRRERRGDDPNDIVGNAHDENGRRDASTLRLFAEGVPAGKEVTEEWQRRLGNQR